MTALPELIAEAAEHGAALARLAREMESGVVPGGHLHNEIRLLQRDVDRARGTLGVLANLAGIPPASSVRPVVTRLSQLPPPTGRPIRLAAGRAVAAAAEPDRPAASVVLAPVLGFVLLATVALLIAFG